MAEQLFAPHWRHLTWKHSLQPVCLVFCVWFGRNHQAHSHQHPPEQTVAGTLKNEVGNRIESPKIASESPFFVQHLKQHLLARNQKIR